MPFGAAVRPDGTVRFRLWAPAVERVQLELSQRGATKPMHPLDDGWHELVVAAASGEPYAFVLPDGRRVADPASRCQAEDAAGPSLIVDPAAYRWQHAWVGRPWHEAVVYELHVGTFTPEGTFRAAIERLPHLAELGRNGHGADAGRGLRRAGETGAMTEFCRSPPTAATAHPRT